MVQTGFFAGRGRFGGMFEMGEMFFMMMGEQDAGSRQTQTTAGGRPRMPERKPATTVNRPTTITLGPPATSIVS